MDFSDFKLVKTDKEIMGVTIRDTVLYPFIISLHNKDYEDFEPITLLINPKSLQIRSTYDIQETRVRGFFISNLWGTTPLDISANINSGVFYTKKHGVTNLYRGSSKAFNLLMNVLSYYKLNALSYSNMQVPDVGFYSGYHTKTTIIDRVGLVGISYHTLFGPKRIYGFFTNFSYSEGEQPYSIDYTFSFKGITNNLEYVKGHFYRG